MERVYKEKFNNKKSGGGLKDMPRCERCGRPVKIKNEDYMQDEILCPHCAYDNRLTGNDDRD